MVPRVLHLSQLPYRMCHDLVLAALPGITTPPQKTSKRDCKTALTRLVTIERQLHDWPVPGAAVHHLSAVAHFHRKGPKVWSHQAD